MVYIYHSPIGNIYVKCDNSSLVALTFNRLTDDNNVPSSILSKVIEWLDCYFAKKTKEIDFSIKLEVSSFQKEVLKVIKDIPFGQTITYSDIAKRLGLKCCYQAIGQALKHNPILLIYPCHRVVAKNIKKRYSYNAGEDKKKWLLHFEGVE